MIKYEDEKCQKLINEYKLKIEDANFAFGYIPRKIILDRTRNIHSYLVICKLSPLGLESNYWNRTDFDVSVKAMLSKQYSDLDRPLFFLYSENGKDKVIEGNSIREAILDNPQLDLTYFICENSDVLTEVILKIKKEL